MEEGGGGGGWIEGGGLVPIREIFTDILKTASTCTFPLYIYTLQNIHNIVCVPIVYETIIGKL